MIQIMKQGIETLQLSVRAKNCLRQEFINYLDDLVILNESDLLRVPNMGMKSVNEIKEKLGEIGLNLGMEVDFDMNDENPYIKKEPEINIWLDDIVCVELKKSKVENLLIYGINTLSVRSRNGLNAKLKYHSSITEFLKYLFSLPSVSSLPSIGKTSELEINTLLVNLRQEIEQLYKSEETTINTTLDLMERMRLPQSLMDEYNLNHQNNNINFFTIVDLFIKNDFSENKLKILQHRNDYWNKNQMTLEALGKELGVTRERIRQIEVKVNKKLWSSIKGLSTYTPLINLKEQYGFDDDFVSNISIINELDKTSFSDNFLYRVLAIFLQDDYRLVITSNNRYRYLIKNSLGNEFDFKGFIDKVKSLLGNANREYKVDFKGLLDIEFSTDSNMTKFESICEDLLNLEFGIVPDIDNQILIKGKIKKSIEIYVEEVLNKVNQPMHLDAIYSKIKTSYPEFNQSRGYIRNVFIGNDKFIFFNRNSTYGLKIWEGELTQNSVLVDIVKPNKTRNDRSGVKIWHDNGRVIVKGGTIINIVIEYLSKFKEPKHIDDIFYEVEKWRDTDKNKLMSNLKVNNRGYFIFYEHKYVGLANE